MSTVCLRAAREEDLAWLFEAFKTTLKPYVEWAWGWDEDFQRNGLYKHALDADFRLVIVDDKLAGGIRTEEQDSLLFVRLIFLLPEFQRREIGSGLLRAEAMRAKTLNKQLHLKVVRTNPAKALYERMGFFVIEEDQATYHMRLPDTAEHTPIPTESTA
ncbi:GNAT family N-acetyltransferase [Uliginosibacterium sp. H3]|uniref:GNAT family N-acetyltransferase n=1 Tax=Uliginosibacterium silvisoli TaxID=3114758 RepID=A0ABU6K612_9RHOO|nr:GNAT family N-acetyltransferase [Uliginosibacterium sp. H3]